MDLQVSRAGSLEEDLATAQGEQGHAGLSLPPAMTRTTWREQWPLPQFTSQWWQMALLANVDRTMRRTGFWETQFRLNHVDTLQASQNIFFSSHRAR